MSNPLFHFLSQVGSYLVKPQATKKQDDDRLPRSSEGSAVADKTDIDTIAKRLIYLEKHSPAALDLDQVRADWLWVTEQIPKAEFDRYRGLTVAVHRGRVLGASDQPLHLQFELTQRFGVHPEQLVMAHIEPSPFI